VRDAWRLDSRILEFSREAPAAWFKKSEWFWISKSAGHDSVSFTELPASDGVLPVSTWRQVVLNHDNLHI
jgi:hypothetical protein